MSQNECVLCKKLLGSSRAYNSHLKSKKHIANVDKENEENSRIINVINEINNSGNDDWDSFIKKYIMKWKLTANHFTKSFYRVLGNIINNASDDIEKKRAIKLIKNISLLYKKPIPEWININSTQPNITNQHININSIVDMELMNFANKLSNIISTEKDKTALILVNKDLTPAQDNILNKIEEYVIFYHNKMILDLTKALETANLFIKHQLEYDLYSKYGSSASEEQVNELISIYRQKFPNLCNLVNNSI
jgi:hypothetical protein